MQRSPSGHQYLGRIWSTAHAGVLRALIEQHGALKVWLCTMASNPVDPESVAICVDLPQFVVGGEPVAHDATGRTLRLIGYIARAEPNKARLFGELTSADTALAALLVIDGADWKVEVEPPIDPEDVPF